MILLYVLVVALLLAGVRSYYIRKNRLAQEEVLRREKERRKKELEQLERENLLKEKRISELEREKLKIDLRNKDKRLANITMNSIRRNNMLNELKSEVSELMTVEGPGRIKAIVGRIIRQINTQLKDDSDWQLSENYFNTIYDGLLDRLRANYPSLSQTDLRLCVYIKLNLSTKETAELMNISPRAWKWPATGCARSWDSGPTTISGPSSGNRYTEPLAADGADQAALRRYFHLSGEIYSPGRSILRTICYLCMLLSA